MNKSKAASTILNLLIILGVVSLFFRFDSASCTSANATFYPNYNDGTYWKESTNYFSAYNSIIGTFTSGILKVGEGNFSGYYDIFRSYLPFDTSSIPDGATIDNATLSLRLQWPPDINSTILIQHKRSVGIPPAPPSRNQYWYGQIDNNTNGGSLATTLLGVAGSWNNITLNADGLSWINETGLTTFYLRNNNESAGIIPIGDESIEFYGSGSGIGWMPVLYVGYTVGGYSYLVHGSFYEDGSIANVNTTVTVYRKTAGPLTFTLHSTGSDYENYTFSTTSQPYYMTWNLTSSDTNKSRYIFFTNSTFEEFWLYLPNPTESYFGYSFTFNDLVGISNAYVSTMINVDGQDRIVERQKLDVLNSINFWFTIKHRYIIRLTCDQGTIDWTYNADVEASYTFLILNYMFPQTSYAHNVTTYATRISASSITVSYNDSDLFTSTATLQIWHKSGLTWVSSYSNTTTNANLIQWAWNGADILTDYYVQIDATRTNGVMNWNYTLPVPSSGAEVFSVLDSIFSDAKIGGVQIPISQIFGFGIVLFTLACFSFASMEVGMIVSLLEAGFLGYYRLLEVNTVIIIFAAVIAVVFAIKRARRNEMEI